MIKIFEENKSLELFYPCVYKFQAFIIFWCFVHISLKSLVFFVLFPYLTYFVEYSIDFEFVIPKSYYEFEITKERILKNLI